MQTARLDKAAVAVFTLYLVALHTSIAAMEMAGWLLATLAVAFVLLAKERPKFDKIIISMLLLVGIVAVSDWTYLGFMRWVSLLIFFRLLLDRIIKNPRWVLIGSKVWFGTLVIVGLYAIVQAFTGIDIVRPGRQATPLGNMFYARGFFSLSITFASTIGMSAAMAFAFALCGPKEVRKWAAVAAGFGILAVIFSLSRATLGAVLVIVPLGIVLTRPKWIIPTVVGLFVTCLVAVTQFSSVQKRLANITNLGGDRSTGMRLNLWQAYWEIFTDHPWFGVGLFNPKTLVPDYYTRLGISETFVSHAHNNVLQWLAGAGIFSALLYIGISFAFLWLSLCIFRFQKDSALRALGLGTLLSQILFHIGGLIECNFFDGEVTHMIVFTWALTLAVYGVTQITSRRRESKTA